MKGYKTFDFMAQAVLILVLATGFVAGAETSGPGAFVIGLGLLQIISLVVHWAKGPQPWKAVLLRKIHLVATGLVFLAIIIGFFQDAAGSGDKYEMPGLGTIIWAGLFSIPVIVFYTVIAGIEWWRIRKEG